MPPNPPSSSSCVTSSAKHSHHLILCPVCLLTAPVSRSPISAFLRREARYMTAMATMSGSHCRHSMVHRLSLMKVQHICTSVSTFLFSAASNKMSNITRNYIWRTNIITCIITCLQHNYCPMMHICHKIPLLNYLFQRSL